MRVRFLGFDHTPSYQGSLPGCEEPWSAREVRDVPDETADYLTSAFPAYFKKEGGRPRKRSLSGPPMDRAIKSPPARVVEPVPADLLDSSIPTIKAALSSGAYDRSLAALLTSEQAGKTRKGVVTLIEARRDLVRG